MAHRMYLLSLRPDLRDGAGVRDDIADLLVRVGGFVLMATGADALVIACDERCEPLFKQHAGVAFCGAVQLDPRGAAARKLQHLFATNVAAQLAHRCESAPDAAGSGARPRPFRWHQPLAPRAEAASGITISTRSFPQPTGDSS